MILLREMRLKRKMTQQELSVRSGIAQGVISDIESGSTQNPRFDTVIKLAKALDCSVADFLNAEETKAV